MNNPDHKKHYIQIAPEEYTHLYNIGYGGLMRSSTPDHIAGDFIKRGLAKVAAGGLMLTEAGHIAVMGKDG